LERASVVVCSQCGLNLEEHPDPSPDQREPCPSCGSVRRSFDAGSIRLVGNAAMFVSYNHLRPGFRSGNRKRLLCEVITGRSYERAMEIMW
jgi:hypothetical protein